MPATNLADAIRDARSLLRAELEARGLPDLRAQIVLGLAAPEGTGDRLHLIGVTGGSDGDGQDRADHHPR